jgi:hypothetical protein
VRRDPAELAGAEIRARIAQREERATVAERDPGDAAEHAEHRRFREAEAREPGGAQAEHAQQRLLAPPARHFERLRREHEEAPGKERHHGEHVQVHAVGAGRIAARLLERVDGGDVDPGRQHVPYGIQDPFTARAAREVHVEPVQLAETPEAPLRGRDVGEGGESLELAHARHFELDHVLPHHEAQRPLAERGGSERRQQHFVRREELRHPLSQSIHADHAEGPFVAPGDAGVELERGVDPRDARDPRDLREERLRKAAAPAAHLQVRLAGHRANGGGELLHGGPVHEVYAVAERHAERDAGDRERRAGTRAAPAEQSEKAQHADYYTGSMKWLLFLGAIWALPVPAQEAPEWFVETFLDVREDAAEAARDGRRLMLYFMQDGCPYCRRLVTVNWREPQIVEKTRRHFVPVAINIWGDREVTLADGRRLPEKRFAAALKVQFTPTLLFFDEHGARRLQDRGLPAAARILDRARRRVSKLSEGGFGRWRRGSAVGQERLARGARQHGMKPDSVGAFDAGEIIVARTAGVTVEIEILSQTQKVLEARATSASVPNAKRVSTAD